jgi:hypothetical protein
MKKYHRGCCWRLGSDRFRFEGGNIFYGGSQEGSLTVSTKADRKYTSFIVVEPGCLFLCLFFFASNYIMQTDSSFLAGL